MNNDVSDGEKFPVPVEVHMPELAPPITDPVNTAGALAQIESSAIASTTGIVVIVINMVSVSTKQFPLLVDSRTNVAPAATVS